MSNDDNQLTSALRLVAGGAAGYAAARYVVDPLLATKPAHALPRASSSTAVASTPAPRALGARQAGAMQPIDPYGPAVIDVVTTPSPHTSPSGDMRPLDPYADTVPSIASTPSIATSPTVATTTPSIATSPSITTAPNIVTTSATTAAPIDGPITMPSQVSISSPAAPIASSPISRPSQVEATSSRPAELTPPEVARPSRPSAHTLSPVFATKPRVRRFDPVFERYRGSLPIEYLRALVERESDGLPKARAGSAIGLMQIVAASSPRVPLSARLRRGFGSRDLARRRA